MKKPLIALVTTLAVISLLPYLSRKRRRTTAADLLSAIETSQLGEDARVQLRELIEDRRLRPSRFVDRHA